MNVGKNLKSSIKLILFSLVITTNFSTLPLLFAQDYKYYQEVQEWFESIKTKRGYHPKLHAYLAEMVKIYETEGEQKAIAYANENKIKTHNGKVEIDLDPERGIFSNKIIAKNLLDQIEGLEIQDSKNIGIVVRAPITTIRKIADEVKNIGFIRPLLEDTVNETDIQEPRRKIMDVSTPPVQGKFCSYFIGVLLTDVSDIEAKRILQSYGCRIETKKVDFTAYERWPVAGPERRYLVKIPQHKELPGFLEEISHDPKISGLDYVPISEGIFAGLLTGSDDPDVEKLRKIRSEMSISPSVAQESVNIEEKELWSKVIAKLEAAPADDSHPQSLSSPSTEVKKEVSEKAVAKAGSHDDNEEFSHYQAYVEKASQKYGKPVIDMRKRYILRVTDQNNQGIPFANVKLAKGTMSWEGGTYPNGEALYFPLAAESNFDPEKSKVEVSYEGKQYAFEFPGTKDGIHNFKLPRLRKTEGVVPVDIVFLIDTTQSMEDEIDSLKDSIYSIHSRLTRGRQNTDLRFGMVLYRDRGDKYLAVRYDFTGNLDNFQRSLNEAKAGGGGDYPEDIQAGLKEAVDNMGWRKDAVKTIFLLGDAPPHLDYTGQENYISLIHKANKNHIKIAAVGASGLNDLGEYIFRQLAIYTYGQFIFLTYGETVESEGRGDASKGDPGKVSHHTGGNYNVKDLDDIVVDLVKKDIQCVVAEDKVEHILRKPKEEPDHIDLRVGNILSQIQKQIFSFSKSRLTAAVIPFETHETELNELAEYLRDVSSESIAKGNWLQLVERAKLDEVLKETKLQMTGLIDPKTAIQLEKILGARLLLLGKVYYLGSERVFYLQAVATDTGQIVAAARVRI